MNFLGKKLDNSFFLKDTKKLAQELIGKVVVKDNLAGIITETECYKGKNDPASHAYKGLTERNKPMFDKGGYSYVYLIYGMYYCFNIVGEPDNAPGAVLIRGIKPIYGIEEMIKNRNYNKKNLKDLSNGPGKFTQAFSISKNHNYLDLTEYDSPIKLFESNENNFNIEKTPRIGISKGVDKCWRYVIS